MAERGQVSYSDIHWISRIANLCPAARGHCPQTPFLMNSLDTSGHPRFKTIRKNLQRLFAPGRIRTQILFYALTEGKKPQNCPQTQQKKERDCCKVRFTGLQKNDVLKKLPRTVIRTVLSNFSFGLIFQKSILQQALRTCILRSVFCQVHAPTEKVLDIICRRERQTL